MGRGEAALGARDARDTRDALGSLAERVGTVMLARDRQLPVLPALEPLLPGGALRRGSVVAVDAGLARPATPASGVARRAEPGAPVGGATSLALALAAGASQAGSWVAAVGLDSLGLVAADQLGLALDRLVLVDDPPARGGESKVGWASVVAALVDGFDVVLVAAGPGVRRRAGDVRRLVARVRERGSVLMAVGGELPGQPGNVRLTVATAAWQGLGERERGYLHRRRVGVVATGRGEAARPRRVELWLPDAEGRVTAVESAPIPLREPRPARPALEEVVGVAG
jgi:hypothetical protein